MDLRFPFHRLRRMMLPMLLTVCLLWCAGTALAAEYPESAHPYAANSDITWTYTHDSEAEALRIVFSTETRVERDYDFLYLTEENGNERKFTDSSLANKIIYVLGDSFTLRLTSDSDYQYYGFRINDIRAISLIEYNEYEENSRLFEIDTSGIITSYKGDAQVVTIPSEINGTQVVGLGGEVFKGNTAITEVVIKEGVQTIGYKAFCDCTSLKKVTIPSTLTSLSSAMFYNCSALESINIPEGVVNIGTYAFYGCTALKSVRLPSALTKIDEGTFEKCSALESIVVPEGVTELRAYAFEDCTSLKTITLPDGLTTIGRWAFVGCNSLESIVIPEGVTMIDEAAFLNCKKLTNVTLSAGLTAIQTNTFRWCSSLKSINIPAGVKTIGEYAFEGCSALASAVVPEGVEQIGDYAFSGTRLAEITLPDSLTSVGEAFLPGSVLLKFGTNAVLEQYAIEHSLEYICDGKSVTSDGIDTVEEKIDWIVDTYISDDMNQYQKALRLYDWVCANAAYDYEAAYGSGEWTGKYDPYTEEGALLGGWAVCDGYADAYMLLLREVGMQAHTVDGYANGGGHEWVIAQIDGKWYQFDPTWDEAGDGSYHVYFALCDAAMRASHTQYTQKHLICNSWEANYFYRNGKYDGLISFLKEEINNAVGAGSYAGLIDVSELDTDFAVGNNTHSHTVACVLNNFSEWDVEGRIELTPQNDAFAFEFAPDEVTVTELRIENLDFNTNYEKGFHMYLGQRSRLNVVTVPADVPVTWTSSNPSVISVGEDNILTALDYGSSDMTVSAGSLSLTFSVTVEQEGYFNIDITPGTELRLGENAQCSFGIISSYTMLPDLDGVTWSSSNETVASVDQNGLISAVGYGTARITAATSSGITRRMQITVCPQVDSILIESSVYESFVGENPEIAVLVETDDPDGFAEAFPYVDITSDNENVVHLYAYYPLRRDASAYLRYRLILTCGQVGAARIHTNVPGAELQDSALVIVHSRNALTLPDSLTEIQAEAFIGTVTEEIILKEGVLSIGSKAFADAAHLKMVILPDSLQTIASDAFANCSDVTFVCGKDTPAHAFVQEMGYKFVLTD